MAKPEAEESLHDLSVRPGVSGPSDDHGHPLLEDHAGALGQAHSTRRHVSNTPGI